MASPSRPVRVRVDRQGRLVLPQQMRDGIVDTPGELLLRRTPDGLLLSPVTGHGSVRIAEDGLPVLDLDRPVTNAEVLAGIEDERRNR
jgi:bifunctional DNA-binding transcriptional regulator/antitoxin component of YhaV-PrlF toxin-antitoxin module